MAKPLLAVSSSTTSVSVCAVLRKLLWVSGRRLSSACVEWEQLVGTPYIACTNDRHEFGNTVVVRHTPFRSATSDAAQTWGRCKMSSSSCLVRSIPISSLPQRRLLTV